MKYKSSIIDFPYKNLDKSIWSEAEGEIKLIPEVREEIIRIVHENMRLGFGSGYKSFFKFSAIISSLATQFYLPSTDLDIKCVVDVPIMAGVLSIPAEYQTEREQMDFATAILRSEDYELLGHPFDWYVCDEAEIENYHKGKADSMYNITTDEWIKKPYLLDVDNYKRKDVIGRAMDEALTWAKDLDGQIGRVNRKLREFEAIQEHISLLDQDEKEKFKEEVDKMVVDIENEMKDMQEKKVGITAERHEAFDKPFEPDLERYLISMNWLPQNIKFKLVQRWGYLAIIAALNELIADDGKLTEEEVPQVDKAIREARE